jgi:hypothetical protein
MRGVKEMEGPDSCPHKEQHGYATTPGPTQESVRETHTEREREREGGGARERERDKQVLKLTTPAEGKGVYGSAC